MKLFHLYLEGGPAPPMTSSICVFHLGISLEFTGHWEQVDLQGYPVPQVPIRSGEPSTWTIPKDW